MGHMKVIGLGACAALLMLGIGGPVLTSQAQRAVSRQEGGAGVPRFELDVTWPKLPLPNDWLLGQIGGLYVDPKTDHIWIANRTHTLTSGEKQGGKQAPSIIEFDQAGNVVQGWGDPGEGIDWPSREHGLAIDNQGNVWVGGNNDGRRTDGSPPTKGDHFIVKFSRNGKFIRQIGREGMSKGSNDTENLGLPAGLVYDPAANEIWVADGYANRRVIVFDNETGAYKRHWGAYGAKPDDAVVLKRDPAIAPGNRPLAKQYSTVHCLRISNDGLVYVCDREHDRIQVFRKDGTFVKEKIITPTVIGAVATDIAFSPDKAQQFMYVADHQKSKILILRRDDMEVIGSFGGPGHYWGQFTIAHAIGVDSKGSIYVSESLEGKRVQKFKYMGLSK